MTEPNEETIDLTGEEADLLTRLRENKVDPASIATGDKAPADPPPKKADEKPPEEAAAKMSIEERVAAATKTAVDEVKRKAEYDQQTQENRQAMRDTIGRHSVFATVAQEDEDFAGDVEARVSKALAEAESVAKIKKMDRPSYLQHIAELTEQVLSAMQKTFGLKERDNANLETRAAGAATGVGGSGTRHAGSGTGTDVPDPTPLPWNAEENKEGTVMPLSRDEKFPTTGEIEKRHNQRVANMRRKGEI